MIVASVASAFPEHVYDQEAIAAALKQYWGPRLRSPELLDRIHSRTRVRRRHLALALEDYPRLQTWGQSNKAWMETAQVLGERAIDAALDRARLDRADLDAIYVVSVTGIASPSLDARLINRMRLRSDIKRTPIFGVGCAGGAIGLVRAADYVRAYPDQVCALLSVELCSFTMRHDDLSMVNIIATGLFADGAAAAILSGPDTGAKGPQILATRSVFYPDSEDIMGWDISEQGFGIVLSPRLPELIKTRLAGDVASFLKSNRLSREQIQNWIIHPGGPRVLEAIQTTLALSDREVQLSWDSLARVGNISSTSVLLVLEDTMLNHRPAPGTLGVMLALGPGFCSEMLLVRW